MNKYTPNVHPEVLSQISKMKKPTRYYLLAVKQSSIAMFFSFVILGVIGVLVYFFIKSGWIKFFFKDLFVDYMINFDIFNSSDGVFIYAIISVVLFAIGGVIIWINTIWGKVVSRKLLNWKQENYKHISSTDGNIVALYQEEIRIITNNYYDKWESLLMSENKELEQFSEWKQTYVELEYFRQYHQNLGVDGRKVKIPLYYFDNYHNKEKFLSVSSELDVSGLESSEFGELFDGIINPKLLTEEELLELLKEKFRGWNVENLKGKYGNLGLKKNNDSIRFKIENTDCSQTVIFLYSYSSVDDIIDLCDSTKIEELIPAHRISIIAFYKEYTKEEYQHRINNYLFNKRFPILQQELKQWNQLLGYPYYYFYNYDPYSEFKKKEVIRDLINTFKDSTPDNRNVKDVPRPSRGVFAFFTHTKTTKYRDAFNTIVYLVSKKISETIKCDVASQVAFVCIPSGSDTKTYNRLTDFYSSICNNTGLDNAYQYVDCIGYDAPKKYENNGLMDFKLDRGYFKDKKVVVFVEDDAVTSEYTIGEMINALTDCGASILFIITIANTTIAKTTKYYNISEHPINSDPIFKDYSYENHYYTMKGAAKTNITISLITVFLLVVSFFYLPIGNYTFLHFIVFIAAVVLIVMNWKEELAFAIFVTALLGILFNPFIPVFLHNKTAWIIIDALAAIWFAYLAIISLKKSNNIQ